MRLRKSPKIKPHSFTDEQIRTKAYEHWQKHPDHTEVENWEAAIKALKQERTILGRTYRVLNYPCVLIGRTLHLFQLAVKANTQSAALEVIKAGISALGLIATAGAVIGLVINYQQGQERLITERFSKSVEQLGSKEINVRIGSIYSLERIAKDSPKDQWSVMEVLTAFVREQSPVPQDWLDKTTAQRKDLRSVTLDVQSTLTVIGRRLAENDPPETHLDLSKTNLQKAFLRKSNLQSADLTNANLQRAKLYNANLQGANLYNANLQRAELTSANLQAVVFLDSNLQGADLYNANLQMADLASANLQGSNLAKANLQQAFLIRVNLQGADLTNANLQQATLYNVNLQGALLYATDLRSTEGLTKPQLEGEQPPLLCNVALPDSFPGKDILKDRDCHKVTAELKKRYPHAFMRIEDAK